MFILSEMSPNAFRFNKLALRLLSLERLFDLLPLALAFLITIAPG